MPLAAAISPMRAAGAVVAVRMFGSGAAVSMPWAARARARSPAWGEATRTVSLVAEAMTSWTRPEVRILPRPMTRR